MPRHRKIRCAAWFETVRGHWGSVGAKRIDEGSEDLYPLFSRGFPELCPVAAREMPGAFEAAGKGDLGDRHFRLQQQVARFLQADFHLVFLG